MKSGSSWTTLGAVLACALGLGAGACRDQRPQALVRVARPPAITPPYAGIVIPPNLAPLHFVIREPGRSYQARIHCPTGAAIEVVSSSGEIVIPTNRWRELLSHNAGRPLQVDICVQTPAGSWNRYEPIVNTIAAEPIDPYLVYRYMTPCSYAGLPLRICQRSLESFAERTVFDAESLGDGCVHCHSFVGNRPDRILLGVRRPALPSATLYGHEGRVDKIGTKLGYTAWHPSGKIVAYSVNDVRQFFHSVRPELHDVVDLDSSIFYYDLAQARIKTVPALADPNRLETYPAWTPDGAVLYFCSAPRLWSDAETVPPARYREVQYDLMRIRYDLEADRWGPLETVLSATDTGRSMLLPRVSPDGRFLLFCMAEYGCFPIFAPTSDLYLMDLRTGSYHPLALNSEYAEGWHSWSSNSRWIVFSSKRADGVFTRTFLCHLDAAGRAARPFLLPQKSPSFYDSCYCLYNMPQLLAGPVPLEAETLRRAALGAAQIHVEPAAAVTRKAPGAADQRERKNGLDH